VKPVIVFGDSGVFGSQVVRELAASGIPLTLAGRDQTRAEAGARALGLHCPVRLADVRRADSCRAALTGHAVAVNGTERFR
jgi:uncharacterized protein YbjT (DUF2867 family)